MASFSIPLSGLTAAQQQLQSVSNNLANMNTLGYKDETTSFSDLFAQADITNGSGDPLQAGSGVQVAATTQNFTEGNLDATGVSSNMAISGNGFFVTQDTTGALSYTRAGGFTTNNQGQLITPSGQLVMGYPAANGVINASAALQPLQIGSATTPAVASTEFQVTANLSSSAAVGDSAPASTFAVYDSLGAAHTISVNYEKTATNTWTYSVTMPTADLNGSTSSTGTTQLASGTLNFDSSGQLVLGSGASNSISISLPGSGGSLADGAAPMSLSWNLTDQTGNPTITQTSMASASSAPSQNGYPSGSLSSYTVQPDGTILGTFSSGKSLALGQVAVASFANVQGLAPASDSNYQATVASGTAVIGTAGTGGRGTIVGGSVEDSNVDIATEFAKMISAQQAYSANAKAVTTFDQVSQATISMIQ